MNDELARRLIGDDQTADDIVAWLSDWADQEGAPDGTAEWLRAQRGVIGTALTRVLDWPRADYGSAWAELRGFLGESVKVGRPLDLEDLRYVDGLHRQALEPVAEWMVSRIDPEPPAGDEPARWRVGSHYGIHVYEGDRPVATFLHAADAHAAVLAYNSFGPAAPDTPDGES